MFEHLFPFSAIVAQDALKSALVLSAIDPRIGGVLITGPRGTAKSTLARALSELQPGGPEHFVNLPLGAGEDKLVGSLQLDKAMSDGQLEFAPGLLAKAHEGILYVDEVNLLADSLVDLLLDTAASGVNHVERDGISQHHAARFVLIGTMNPDEGELRPQLLDRFGLCVEINDTLSTEERVAVMRARLEFDSNPAAFRKAYASQQNALIQRCQSARQALPSIQISDEIYQHIAQYCQKAHVEGLRADIVMLHAARAYAAFNQHPAITLKDVDQVAPFALFHRRNEDTPSSQQPSTPPPSKEADTNTSQDQQGQWGALPATDISASAVRESAALSDKKKAY